MLPSYPLKKRAEKDNMSDSHLSAEKRAEMDKQFKGVLLCLVIDLILQKNKRESGKLAYHERFSSMMKFQLWEIFAYYSEMITPYDLRELYCCIWRRCLDGCDFDGEAFDIMIEAQLRLIKEHKDKDGTSSILSKEKLIIADSIKVCEMKSNSCLFGMADYLEKKLDEYLTLLEEALKE